MNIFSLIFDRGNIISQAEGEEALVYADLGISFNLLFARVQYFFNSLKLKIIHKCFLCSYKRQSSVLCFFAFRFLRIPAWDTMQEKHAIERTILHKLPIYKEYMCLCWVSTLFCMICSLFYNCSKSSITVMIPIYTVSPVL